MPASGFDKPRIFGYESAFQLTPVLKGRIGLVEHNEDIRSRPDFAEGSLVECPDRAPTLLRGAMRPQLYILSWLARHAFGSITGLVLVLVLGSGLLVLYFARGPIAIAGVGPRITQALNEKIGHGYAFKLGEVSIVKRGFGPAISIDHLSLTGSSGEPILTAPRAEVSIDLLALLFGKIVPKRLEVFDIEVRLALLPDGSLAVSAGSGQQSTLPLLGPLIAAMGSGGSLSASPVVPLPAGPAVAPGSPNPPRSLIVKRIGAAMRLLIDLSTRPNGPLAAIDRVGIARGRFVIEDRLNDETKLYEGLKLSLEKSGDGTNLDLSAEGPNGPWSVAAKASGAPGGERRLDIGFNNITLDEISIVSGMRNIGADFDMPISSKFAMVLAADGGLSDVAGHVHLDPGYLRFEDPNDEPRLIDSIDADLHWDRAARRIAIDNARLRAGETDFGITGAIAPPVREGDPWTINLTNSQRGIFGPERPGEDRIFIDHIGLQGRLQFTEKSLFIDRFEFNGPNSGLAMAGVIDWKNGPHVRLGASISPTPATVAVRLWPSFMAADVRAWFLAHWKEGIIQRGTVQVDFDAAMIDSMRRQHPPPDSALAIDFAISGGAVEFLSGVPVLSGIDGTGHVTGHTSTFVAKKGMMDLGAAGKLSMSDGSFHVPNAEIRPTPAELLAKVSGSVEAVGDLLSRDALKPYASLPVDSTTLKGQIDGTLGIGLKLGPGARPADTVLNINSTVTDFSADKLVGNEKLENATLNVVVDADGLRATGQGRIFGAPANLDISKPGNKPGQASITLVMDDALRAKQGLNVLPGVTGPIGTHLTTELGVSGPVKAQVELDLTHAAIEGLMGISKPAGKPGKASFSLTVNDDHSTSLDQVAIDAAPLLARGTVQIGGADPSQVSAKFSQARVSPGDDMKVDLSKTGDTLKMVVRATTLDGRPFLKNLTFAHPEQTAGPDASPRKDNKDNKEASKDSKDQSKDTNDPSAGTDLDIDLKSTTLTGFNKETMSNVDLHFVKNGSTLKQFALSGRFSRGTITGNLNNAGTPSPQLDLSTEDAGALLSFIDLYRHMEGGQLAVGMRLGNDAMAGTLAIKDFVLRDEPALRRLVAEGTPQNTSDLRQQFDPAAVPFTRLQVNFQRAGTRLDLHDGTIYGTQIGLTVDGWLDFARDRVSLDGTFVPAYAVNNLFSQIPVFGLFLGGGSHEGLFAVNYEITGAATKPTLNINPLSAIAPGFLRKIFGFTDYSDPAAAPGGLATQPER